MMGEVIRVSGRAPDVGDLLREAMVSQRFADVALCCSGGQRFLAHRLVLSAASPYLQKVLLAHGKAAGYCERITVILAEVEGPELAAILGFVYTGSATIARSRLEAFTRAAETLQVRIPPFDNRRSVNECKLDNVKIEETKIDTRYIGCEQYPNDEKSFKSTSWPFDGYLQRRDWIAMENPGMSSFASRSNGDADFRRDATRLRRSCMEGNEKFRLRDREIFHNESWIENNLPIYDERYIDRPIGGSRSEDGSCHESRSRFIRRDTFGIDNNSVSRMSGESVSRRRWDEATKIRVEGVAKQRDNNDFEGRLAESVPSLPLVHRTTGRSSITFEKQDYDAATATLTVASSGSVPTTATVTSNIATTSSPICGESCCRWTTPRRHVANRVPASPWIQLAKPAHHSPKIQPIVLRNREEIEDASRPEWNELTSLRSSKRSSPFPSVPLNLHHGASPIVDCSLYDNRLSGNLTSPHLRESTNFQFNVLSNGLEESPSRIAVEEVARTLSFDEPVASSPEEGSITGGTGVAQPRGVLSHHAINPEAKKLNVNDPTACNRQASPRVELSHPISRLCDTLNIVNDNVERDDSTNDNNSTAAKTESIKLTEEETSSYDAKLIFPLTERIVQSDNNNNEADSPISEVTRNLATIPGDSIGTSEDHKCEQCGKTFVTRASLKVHGRTHSGEKPFRCNDCGKEFSQLRNYKYHRSVHEGTREFAATCPECGKYFNDRGYLSSHMKIHRNRKEYACAECGKSFNQRVAYNMHVRIHTGVKPHQCEECGKAFSRKMLLKQHLRTHSGERPYQCEICHKAFADRSNMTLHTRLHSGLKPYQCTLCTKAFTKKHHLKTHLNYHTGTKPYSCPNCSLRFSQSSNMRTHYKKCIAAGGGNSTERSNSAGNDNNSLPLVAPSELVPIIADDEKPTTGRTNALTPPSSDQESSSIPTPSQQRKSNRTVYPSVESKLISDT